MSVEQYLETLKKYAKSLVKNHYDEDWRDLVQDTVLRILSANPKELNEGYIIQACKNTWRDTLAYKAVRCSNKTISIDDITLKLSSMPVQEDRSYLSDISNVLDKMGNPGAKLLISYVNGDKKKYDQRIFKVREFLKTYYT